MYVEVMPEEIERVARIEEALLCKERVFRILLSEEYDKLDYEAANKKEYKGDAYRFYKEVEMMSLVDVAMFLEKKRSEKYDKECDYRSKEIDKKDKEKKEKPTGGLFGPAA